MFTINEHFFKKASVVFFAIFFIVGVFVFSDYGIYWDENVQRTQIGEINYQYIVTGDNTALLANFHKYYGPAFEVVLSAAENFFGAKDVRAIFLLRHAICFLSFYAAALCFYLLCLKLFKSNKYALLGVAMFVLSPRIFAESFYNSKDLSMLCFCTIAAYTMFLFVEKQTLLMAALHALACGFVVDVRIMGVLIPIATVYLFILSKQKNILAFVLFVTYTCLFIIAFWPVMWMDPIKHFIEAFKQMSNYPVLGSTNLYLGENVPAANLPWHYLPVWIVITTPILYSVFFVKGLFFVAKNMILDFRNTAFLHAVLFVLFAPIMAVILLNSTLYDGWRHVFFIYPFFLIIALYGFVELMNFLQSEKHKRILSYLTLSFIAWIVIVMIKNHPYQNVYFNFMAGSNLQKRFEMDYWGLSYKQALEYIAENDKSPEINIAVQNLPGILNFNMLTPSERERLKWNNNQAVANYYLTNFRNHPQDFDIGTSVHKITVDGEKIMEIIKLN